MKLRDISLAGRILASFPEHLTAQITYTEVSVHSRTAMSELSKILDQFSPDNPEHAQEIGEAASRYAKTAAQIIAEQLSQKTPA